MLDATVMPATLAACLGSMRVPIKAAPLDQHIVVGMGNRDAAESFWRARSDPRCLARDVKDEAANRRTEAMRAVLEEGIIRRGTQPYLWGWKGTQLEHRQAFERAGQPCPRCGALMAWIRPNNRNTFYCPGCRE
jgi:formamidopyrimidine-DNA glycosylase